MKTNSVEPVLFQTETGLKKVPRSLFKRNKNPLYDLAQRLFIKNLYFFTPKCVPLMINNRKKLESILSYFSFFFQWIRNHHLTFHKEKKSFSLFQRRKFERSARIIIIIRRKKYGLTIEPALFHAETGPEERVLRLGRKMIEKGGQTGDQKGATPRVAGVHS